MIGVVEILGTVTCIAVVGALIRMRNVIRGTSLTTAWGWAAAAAFGMGLSSWGSFFLPPPVLDQIWVLTAILANASAIAVLGARRPGDRAWNWFVLLPLVLILGWPLTLAWTGEGPIARLILMDPALLAFILVSIMGFGNYTGTRHGPAALGIGMAVCLIVISNAPIPWFSLTREIARPTALALILCSSVFELMRRRTKLPSSKYDRVWVELRDALGTVWSLRIRDRLNYYANHFQWPTRLEWEGFTPPVEATEGPWREKFEETFRWLLSRFVDPDWIEKRTLSP